MQPHQLRKTGAQDWSISYHATRCGIADAMSFLDSSNSVRGEGRRREEKECTDLARLLEGRLVHCLGAGTFSLTDCRCCSIRVHALPISSRLMSTFSAVRLEQVGHHSTRVKRAPLTLSALLYLDTMRKNKTQNSNYSRDFSIGIVPRAFTSSGLMESDDQDGGKCTAETHNKFIFVPYLPVYRSPFFPKTFCPRVLHNGATL